MSAVERGDMETAQKMVDEAAVESRKTKFDKVLGDLVKVLMCFHFILHNLLVLSLPIRVTKNV